MFGVAKPPEVPMLGDDIRIGSAGDPLEVAVGMERMTAAESGLREIGPVRLCASLQFEVEPPSFGCGRIILTDGVQSFAQ